MDLHLTGKLALVTGASKGIGLAIARALAEEGAHVVGGARQPSAELEQLAEKHPVHFVAVDLSTPDGPAHLVTEAISNLGGLDLLVNNVGAAKTRLDGFLTVTDMDWTESLTLTFLAAVRTTRMALPHLLERKAGSIVTICSVNSRLPDPRVIDYSAAKAALLNFCKSLSKEVGHQGIRVNTVSPGPVATDLWLGKDGVAETTAKASGNQGATPLSADAVAQRAAQDMLTGRFTRPEEVADLVVFLASNRTGNVTGADFVIDGGLITTV